MNEDRIIVLVGDFHGEWEIIKRKIDYKQLTDCYFISVGDIGIGFSGSKNIEMGLIERMNEWFKERNIIFMGIRGNHDDPAYFDGSIDLSNFKLLKDYTYLTLNGQLWGFVGGAISIDRKSRVEGLSYWKDEPFVLDREKIKECDVLVTHSGPTWIGPFDKNGLQYYGEDVLLDCRKERTELGILYFLSKAKKAYLGHFHECSQITQDGCKARIIDINEFVEHFSVDKY